MSDKKNLARIMYVVEGKNYKEIAQAVGVVERTVYSWVHQYSWKKLKSAAAHAPATISENLSSQLVELQNKIAAREPGNRIPTSEEAEITRKLVIALAGVNKKQSLAQYMQVMESFRDFVRPFNSHFSKQLAHYTDKFFTAQSQNGYLPWQMEYGAEKIAALAPVYDELEAGEPCDPDNPPAYRETCNYKHQCKLETGCDWPKCKYMSDLYPVDNDPQPDDSWPLQPVVQPSGNAVAPENLA